MTASRHARASATIPADPRRRYALLGIGLAAFCGLLPLGGGSDLWFPSLGLGLTLVSWFGLRLAPLLAVAVVAVRALGGFSWIQVADGALVGAEIALGWWIYDRIAKASRWLEDPRSSVLFLLLLPGAVHLTAAALQALWTTDFAPEAGYVVRFGTLWISRALAVLMITPFLWVVVTPLLQAFRFLDDVKPKPFSIRDWNFGEGLELIGLVVGNAILSVIQVVLHSRQELGVWPMWGLAMLLVVWSALRQSLRGGATTAFVGCTVAVAIAAIRGDGPSSFSPLQGNLLAQCSVALLVGSAVGWIRLSEARYRQVVGHIPLVLSSVRLVRGGVALLPHAVRERSLDRDERPDLKRGAEFISDAEIILVSKGAKTILGVEPGALIGPFEQWLELVHSEDRPIMVAAISQMGLQRQTVTYEFRVQPPADAGANGASTLIGPVRWLRETLSPHYSAEGLLDGWDGIAEDITEQRRLQNENRRVTAMLQALVANMPTGIFFIQGPAGQPILVNARARQLLGQREDVGAGLVHLSKVYRLHRSDGTEYPYEELPVTRALRFGQTSTANDVMVHRPDGRRLPLFTWAAPVYLSGGAKPDAAVWVMEDLSAFQTAEFERRETEARLRAVFESLVEGIIVQNQSGVIIEANPAATVILGVPLDQLVGRSWLAPDGGCVREDGSPFPSEQLPDRVAVETKLPVRDVTVGLPREGRTLWLRVNSQPLPVGTAFAPNTKGARVLTSFIELQQTEPKLLAVECGIPA